MIGSLRRLALSCVCLSLTVVPLAAGPAWAGTKAEYLLDEFNTVSYSGDDGTRPWSGAWTELGESDGPSAGKVQVVGSQCSGQCLRLGGSGIDLNGMGVKRQADLSGAMSATLCFDYRRELLADPGGNVHIWVSDNGGSTWSKIASYDLDETDSGLVHVFYDISPWISSQTKIKIEGEGGDVESYVYFDNIEIKADYPSPNEDPTFKGGLEDQKNAEGDKVFLDAGGTDPDSSSLTYSATGLPPDISIDAETGLISGLISYDASEDSPFSVRVTVDDGEGGSANHSFTWTVVDTNRPPVIQPIEDVETNAHEPVTFVAQASDPDGDPLTFLIGNAPAGASIEAKTGVFTWTPNAGHAPGAYTFYVKAIDEGGLYSKTWPTITVLEPTSTPNGAPTITTTFRDISSTVGEEIAVEVNASDPDGDSLRFKATGLPPGLTIDTDTGLISGTVAENAAIEVPYRVTITVSDDGDPVLNADVSFDWDVDPVARPTIVIEDAESIYVPPLDDPGSPSADLANMYPADPMYVEKVELVVDEMVAPVANSDPDANRELSPLEGLMVSFLSTSETITDHAVSAVILGVIIAWLAVAGVGKRQRRRLLKGKA